MQVLDNSVWIDKNNTVYQFQFSKGKIYNFDRPYLGYLIQYAPGPYFYANQKLIELALDLNNTIILPYMNSVKYNENSISWDDGTTWKRVRDIPKKNEMDNIYHYAYALSQQNTNILYDRTNKVYGQHPVVRGQILPK